MWTLLLQYPLPQPLKKAALSRGQATVHASWNTWSFCFCPNVWSSFQVRNTGCDYAPFSTTHTALQRLIQSPQNPYPGHCSVWMEWHLPSPTTPWLPSSGSWAKIAPPESSVPDSCFLSCSRPNQLCELLRPYLVRLHHFKCRK